MKIKKNTERNENSMDYNQMPFGYEFALAGSVAAEDYGYSNMSDDEKREYIERHRSMLSESELERLTSSLGIGEEEVPHFKDPTSLFKGPSIG